MNRIAACLLLATATVPAAPLLAQAATDDVRCVIVSNMFANAEKDAGKKQLAVASSFYYLGRVDARMTQAQLKTQIVTLSKAMTGANVGATMTECAKRLQARQLGMQTMGREIVAANPASAAPAPPKPAAAK